MNTQSQQLAFWASVFLEYAKKNMIFVWTTETFDGFTNSNSLNRSLITEFKIALVSYIAKQKLFVSDELGFLVFWQKP